MNREIEDGKSMESVYTEAVKTICKLIVDPSLLQIPQRIYLIEKVQKSIKVDKILEADKFIESYSTDYQKFIFKLIEIVGLRRVQSTRDAVN